MHRADRGRGERFEREIAGGNSVERIGHRPLEAKLARGHMPVDGERGSGERGGAERRLVDALPCIGEAGAVAGQHLDIGEAVMAEGDGLRGLHMCEARHERGRVGFGLLRERQLKRGDLAVETIDGATHIQPEIGCDLVVA